MKLKVGFEIEAEVLFGMLSKMLPIDNLSVEEMGPTHVAPQIKIAKIAQQIALVKTRKRPARTGYAVNPNKGVNKIIMEMLADGKPHKAVEAKPLMKAAGYATSGTGSKMQRLREHGYVNMLGNGFWQITERNTQKAG